jgi:hypothetical protein
MKIAVVSTLILIVISARQEKDGSDKNQDIQHIKSPWVSLI